MTSVLMVISAAMGWCGTLFPGWWRGPQPPKPEPEPWVRSSAIAVAGGLAGGYLVTKLLTVSVILVGIGGFAGGLAALAFVDRLSKRMGAE